MPPLIHQKMCHDGITLPLAVAFDSAASSDPDGTIVARYWNPGHLFSLLLHDADDDGTDEIYVGATNNDEVAGATVPVVFALELPWLVLTSLGVSPAALTWLPKPPVQTPAPWTVAVSPRPN